MFIVLSSLACISASDIDNITVSDDAMANQEIADVVHIADTQLSDNSADTKLSASNNNIVSSNENPNNLELPPVTRVGNQKEMSLLIEDKIKEKREILESQQTNRYFDLNDLNTIIKQEPAGSTIELYYDYGTISNKLIININKDLTIDGHGITIDLAGSSKHDHYFKITDASVTFKNIKFINGYDKDDDKGGALYFKGKGIATIINCTFENCWAESCGGAIYCENKINIYNSTFTKNTAAKGKGGAVFSKGDVVIYNTTFDGNHAKEDGGAVFTDGKTDIKYSTFESNTATGKSGFQNYGGAVCSKGDVTITKSAFKNNKADDYGGAIYSYKTVIIQDSADAKTVFSGNYAGDEHGGAFYAKGNVNIKNVLFSDNLADGDGGAVYTESNLNAVNIEFSKNQAKVDGGAILCKKDSTIINCIFENNKASESSKKCHGGAIRGKYVLVDNCTFSNNYADNYGGAIYAESMKITENPSYFMDNGIYNGGGGAIYVDTFTSIIKNALFSDNEAAKGCSDGGAIYIKKKCNVTFEKCVFISNHCGDDGGAIFVDCSDVVVNFINSMFIGNRAEDEGDTVFTEGWVGKLVDNFWGGDDPTKKNNQLIEGMVFFLPDYHTADKAPLKLQLAVRVEKNNDDTTVKVEAAFHKKDGSYFDGELYNSDLISFILIPNMKTLKEVKSTNGIYGEFKPLTPGTYTILVKCYDFYTYVEVTV